MMQIVGWASWFFGFVFLERSWAKDEGYLKVYLYVYIIFYADFNNMFTMEAYIYIYV